MHEEFTTSHRANAAIDWDSESCHTDLPSLADVSDYDTASTSSTSNFMTTERQEDEFCQHPTPRRAGSVQFLEQTRPSLAQSPTCGPVTDCVFCPSMLIDSITTFLSCTLTANKDNNVHDICSKGISKRQTDTSESTDKQQRITNTDVADSRTSFDQCLQYTRIQIENDIVDMIGGAEILLQTCNKSMNCLDEEDLKAPTQSSFKQDKMKPKNRISSQRKTVTNGIFNLKRGSFSRDSLNTLNLSACMNSDHLRLYSNDSNSDQHIETFPHVFRHHFPVVSIRSAEYVSETKSFRDQMYHSPDAGAFKTTSCPVEHLPTSYLNRLLGIPSQPIENILSLDSFGSVEIFYDSDPGNHVDDFSSTSTLKVTALSHEEGEDNSTKVRLDADRNNSKKKSTAKVHEQSSVLDYLNVNEFDTTDSKSVTLLINELVTRRFHLIWYPNRYQVNLNSNIHLKPIQVNAYLEMGQCLKSLLVQPKFMWRSNTQRKQAVGKKRLECVSFPNPTGIELLNIIRIIAPASIDKSVHPFVKVEHCFIICNSLDEEYLFETATMAERDRLVFSLKLLVARLASMIIVGDKDVFDQFFTPWGIMPRKKKIKKTARRRKKGLKVLNSENAEDSRCTRKQIKWSRHARSESTRSNFVSSVVEQEGARTDELWGS